MERVGSFVNISSHDFYFGDCAGCDGMCCDGRNGFAASPLILEDFNQVFERFPIVFTRLDGELRALVLLNNGKGYCPYFSQGCTIYSYRTPACRLYPVSPYFSHILVDSACPSIGKESKGAHTKKVCQNGVLLSEFFTTRLDGFAQKQEETRAYFSRLDILACVDDFRYVGSVLGVRIFAFIGECFDSYIAMHQDSLSLLPKWNLDTEEGEFRI